MVKLVAGLFVLPFLLGGCGSNGFGCGDLGFGPCGPAQTFETTLDVTTADFNGDGHVDVALPLSGGVTPPGYARVYLHVSMSGAGYQPLVDWPSGQDPYNITAGDLDGDGLPDLVLGNSHHDSVSVLLNQRAQPGHFSAPQTLNATFASVTVLADMNGDGRADIIIAASPLLVALQDPTAPGHFLAPTTLYASPSGKTAWSLAVGDLNGDGIADVAMGNGEGVRVLLHSAVASEAVMASAQLVYPANSVNSAPCIGIGDVNGDGRNDLVITDSVTNQMIVLIQDPAHAGQFLPPVTYAGVPNDLLSRVVVTDLDGDGRVDVAVGATHAISVVLQDPAHPGTFLPAVSYPAGLGGETVSVADVNEDGYPDLVTEMGVSSTAVGSALRTPPGVLLQDGAHRGHFLAVQNLQ